MSEFTPPGDRLGRSSRAREIVADGSGHVRQTLVVGRGPAALAAAAFLEQAGLEPVLADRHGSGPGPEVTVLWRPGLELLERIGLRRPVEATGTALRELRCIEPARSWTGTASTRPSLVAIRRECLEELLTRHLAGRIRRADRAVGSVRSTDTGVRVTFDGGITEPFDAVATTDRTLVTDHDSVCGPASLQWWSFEWPETVPAPQAPTEAWGHSGAAFTVPVGSSVRGILVTTDRTASPPSPGRLGAIADPFRDALEELDQSSFGYGRTPNAVPREPFVDGVALVGPAVHVAVPGGCLGAALAVEDSWVLADALAYGPASVDAALAEYADRRRRRLSAVHSAVREESPPARISGDRPEVLGQLCARRSLAFSHLFGGIADELAQAVPERL